MIDCNFFGLPIVYEDGEEIILPINKVSALLYYVLIKKAVSREELSGMFWCDSSEQKARTSLRNALHKIRHLFKNEILVSKNKSIITINEDLDINIDVELFGKDPVGNIDKYKGEFLKGFYLKEVIEFENWMTESRDYYRETFIEVIIKKMEEDFENEKFEELEQDAKKLLKIDKYNEEAYLYLFKYYQLNERIDKIINGYYELQELLENDLGVSPSEELTKIYKDSLSSINEKKMYKKTNESAFFGRNYDKEVIQKQIDAFKRGDDFKSVLVCGEAGIGKSVLKKEIMNANSDIKFFEADCLKVEQVFAYSPWVKIISSIEQEFHANGVERPLLWEDLINNFFFLGKNAYQPKSKILENRENFSTNLIYNAIINAIDKLSESGPVILTIEDIQWADSLSIKLLTNLLLKKNKGVFLLLTKSSEYTICEENIIFTLKDINKIEYIELSKFSRKEVGLICKKLINKKIDEAEIDDIYFKSKGNAFFLNEYIQLYNNKQKGVLENSKIQAILFEKFSMLKDTERKVLEIASVLYENVNVDLILKVLNLNAFEVIDCINSLIKLNILEQREGNGTTQISFAYSAYKDYVYNSINDYSKEIMHNEIGQMLEKDLVTGNNTITTYVRLKYHFERAKNQAKKVKYEIYMLSYYLNFTHEIFPSLNDSELSKQVKLYIDNAKVTELIERIELEINEIKAKENSKEDLKDILKSELLFLYCKGRYFIREGNYVNGVKIMNRVIQFAEQMKDYKIALNGHKQMAIYSIQIINQELMLKHLIAGIEVAKAIGDNLELGIFYRLYGVYHMNNGDFEKAEELFMHSIDTFEYEGILEGTNSISTAANYNYIGEIRRTQGKLDEALEYFEKSIELCENTEASCLSIFYINAGKTLFLKGEVFAMKDLFYKAESIIKRFDSYWKKPVLEAYLALVNFLDERFNESAKLLKNALQEVKTINNSRDIGYIYFIQTIICYIIKRDEAGFDKDMESILVESYDIYYYNAIKYLDKYRDAAEIEYLKANIKFD